MQTHDVFKRDETKQEFSYSLHIHENYAQLSL
jgi:hypothetical protein